MTQRRLVSLITVVAVAFAATGSASAEPAKVTSKRAQAQQVLTQIQSLDSSLAHAIEAYNLANGQLNEIKADLASNRVDLRIATANLKRTQDSLAARAFAIYTSGQTDSTLDVLVGSRSLTDLVDGLEAISRVSEQDTDVLRDVRRYGAEVKRRRANLKNAHARQQRLLAERASTKASIESRLSERRNMLSSIRSQIAEIQAAERRRQVELERQARARLAAPRPLISELSSTDPVAETPSFAPPAAPSRYGGVVGIAMQYLGIPYKWGGSSPSTGFDCSGFIMYVYAQVGVSLPHNAAAQYGLGTPVDRSQLQPGDLVFFNGLGHNGIYIGGNQMIHAPHTGDVVKISPLTGWYASTWVGAKRL